MAMVGNCGSLLGSSFSRASRVMGSVFSSGFVTLPYGRERGWVESGHGQPFGVGDRSYVGIARRMYRAPHTYQFRGR